MRIVIDARWRVNASHAVDLPLPARAVWGQMRDLKRFVTIDPLHRRVRSNGPGLIPRVGDALIIEHRMVGIGPDRVGRLLRWNEGVGYAFSDLSRRGVHVGFPHVCQYAVSATGPHTSRLTVSARGRWTAKFVPRPLIKLWLWWVMRGTLKHIEMELLGLAVTLRLRRRLLAGP